LRPDKTNICDPTDATTEGEKESIEEEKEARPRQERQGSEEQYEIWTELDAG
jgi:hypothetical protein